ncbi:hypothetical protein QOZ80_1BG0052410 [Eleusine coracana subsp. coracana]|nr:hypothetical protein QOZ80_1BG0052410 [Eleusine coracana subsp. coracana]
MAEIGGMLAAAVLKLAATKVAEAAGDRFMLQWRFGEDMENMRETMESIAAVLQDAERRSIKEEAVRLWLKRLTGASYRITDIFDEFEVSRTRKSALRKFRVLTLASEVRMAGKMKVVREKLDSISNERDKYSLATSSGSNNQQVINDRATSPEVIEAEIIGRDEEKQKIVALLSTSSDFIIVPICGIGGIGKTTLAQLLFNDTYFKDYKKAWVYVSQTFDLNTIKESVRSQLRLEQGQLANSHEQNAGPPAPKSILIVLDDLWEQDDLKMDDLKKSLRMVGKGHKVHIIVMTRDAGIAHKIQTVEAHKIKALAPEVCWTIIKQIADFENRSDKDMLKDIGNEISAKCGGVALAARAVGFMLRSRDVDGWVSVKDSALWNVSTPGYTTSVYDNVLASLKLSYSSMPPHLRLCFAYCAIFPKGHKMAKDELIYQWAALGFIMPSDKISIQQHGEAYIKQLLDMSFFQRSEYRFVRKYVTLFTMHDLVHDLATSIMGDDLLYASKEFIKCGQSSCRYAFLAGCSKPLNSYVTYPDKIRALRFLGSGGTRHSSIGFSTAKYVRVLDLGGSFLEKLSSSIGQLKLLRYLNAPGIKDRVIPSSLSKLSKLIYLSLRGSSNISAVPESIGKIKGLMYLDLSNCEQIEKLPESFGKLGSSVHLDLSNCHQLNGIPEVLCSLTNLQHLNLSNTQCLLPGSKWLHEVIGELTKLRYLNLSLSLGSFHFNVDEYPGVVGSVLDKISSLSNLEHLDLSYGYFVTLPDSFCSLRKLHTLDLTDCDLLQELPKNMDRMDSLKFLIGVDYEIIPINKNLIPLPNFIVHDVEGEPSSNLILLKDVNPNELKISRLENVKSIEEARRIELRGKQTLRDLALDWTRGTNGYVEDMELLRELVPPSNLKRFELRGYNSMSFPAWLMGTAIYLPNLCRVQLKNLPTCNSSPTLGELANLRHLNLEDMPNITKIDRGFCGDGMKAFPRLQELIISEMENLEQWITTYPCGENVADEFMFPNLEKLEIRRCPNLRMKPCPPRVKKTWYINDSDGVLSQWEEDVPHTFCSTSSAPILQTLQVQSYMAPMHEWKLLHHFSLSELIIYRCNDLRSSSEVT